jgi:hypothetical protein
LRSVFHLILATTKTTAQNGHSDRREPTLFLLLRSCEAVGSRSGGIPLRFVARASQPGEIRSVDFDLSLAP